MKYKSLKITVERMIKNKSTVKKTTTLKIKVKRVFTYQKDNRREKYNPK
jgi:hypothetical protein